MDLAFETEVWFKWWLNLGLQVLEINVSGIYNILESNLADLLSLITDCEHILNIINCKWKLFIQNQALTSFILYEKVDSISESEN